MNPNDIGFKRTVMNLSKEFKKFKEYKYLMNFKRLIIKE